MVPLILAVIWAAVLIPPILRARAEGTPADSVGDFRRRLNVLQRTTPSHVAPANTLRIAGPRSHLTGPVGRPALGRASAIHRHRATQKRRRDVFLVLLAAMGGSLVFGMVPALRVLWTLHVILDVLFVLYVGALVYLKNLQTERSAKVRYIDLTAPAQPEPALLLRRTAN